MSETRFFSTLAIGLVLASAPIVASAQSLEAAPFNPALGASGSAASLHTGRSVAKMRRKRTPGSYTNGRPDGANTGNRKQTPTGGNPGNGDHS